MKSKHTQGPWIAAKTPGQGLIISESTGANVAVTYDVKDVDLVAASCDLFDAAQAIENEAEECIDFDGFTAMLVPMDAYHKLMDAINKAKGL